MVFSDRSTKKSATVLLARNLLKSGSLILHNRTRLTHKQPQICPKPHISGLGERCSALKVFVPCPINRALTLNVHTLARKRLAVPRLDSGEPQLSVAFYQAAFCRHWALGARPPGPVRGSQAAGAWLPEPDSWGQTARAFAKSWVQQSPRCLPRVGKSSDCSSVIYLEE